MPLHSLTRRLQKHAAALLFAAAVLVPGGLWMLGQSPTAIIIMHTNDLHGQVMPRFGFGGIAEISTLIAEANPDLILDAGDMFTGTVVTDEFKGLPIIQAMSRIGYTAAALGNHEFDYGMDVLQQRARDAKFPILTANIKTGIPEIKSYTVVTVKGIRFGIIGLTTEEVRTTTHPKNLGNVSVNEVVKSVAEVMPELRNRADVILVLSHMARPEEERIASAFPEIRLIVSGHSHSVYGPYQLGQTTVVKTGSSGRNVGRVDLQVQNSTITKIDAKLIPVANVRPDPEVARIIQPYEAEVAAKMNVVLGEATGDFNRESNRESALSNLVADAFREATGTQVAIHNLGGIRANIPKGPITWGRAFETLPFQNTLVTVELTGAQLKQILGRALVAVSGARIRVDLSKPVGQKLVSATLADGTPLDDKKVYTVTTNDFVVAGGDGFIEFANGQKIQDTAIFLRDVLVKYVQARRVISPRLDGRVRVN
jgi:2',3'-cyclic-nucleotide 2'-phosphodiesterase (5'-nucleotidase family)